MKASAAFIGRVAIGVGRLLIHGPIDSLPKGGRI